MKDPTTGEVEKRTECDHRCVVAMLVGPVLDVVLDIEPVRQLAWFLAAGGGTPPGRNG